MTIFSLHQLPHQRPDPREQRPGNLREENDTDPAEQPAAKDENHRYRRRQQKSDQHNPAFCVAGLFVEEVDQDQSTHCTCNEEQDVIHERGVRVHAAKARVECDNLKRDCEQSHKER